MNDRVIQPVEFEDHRVFRPVGIPSGCLTREPAPLQESRPVLRPGGGAHPRVDIEDREGVSRLGGGPQPCTRRRVRVEQLARGIDAEDGFGGLFQDGPAEPVRRAG